MFSWYQKRRKARKQFEMDIAAATVAPRLHGVNLVDWAYLGRTTIAYSDTNGIKDEASVFSFCRRDDTDKRQFVVIPHSKYGNFDRHTWLIEHAALWQIGERQLWATVANEPGQWLRDYMLEKYNEVWSADDNWWVRDDSAPVPRKKTKLELVKSQPSDSNVVMVDFSKPRKSKKEE